MVVAQGCRSIKSELGGIIPSTADNAGIQVPTVPLKILQRKLRDPAICVQMV